jgi:hypothetical protein
MSLLRLCKTFANKYFRMSNLQTNATGVSSNVNLTDEDEIARYRFNLLDILLKVYLYNLIEKFFCVKMEFYAITCQSNSLGRFENIFIILQIN